MVVQLSRGSRPMVQIQQLAKAWQLTEEEEKPNPVTQRVKIIMVGPSIRDVCTSVCLS